jgi:hypothetical protein
MKTTLSGITLARHAAALGVGGSIFLCAGARAELKWEQTQIELHPKPNDKQAVAHFKYENVGKTAVRFKSVHASCGCTTAQTQKEEVPAGEKGEITATFNIGGRTGTQVKTVNVQTDDAKAPNTTLTLKAIIPQMLTINPTFVFWKSGEEPKTKTINLKAGADFPIKNVKVACSSQEFTTNVEPGGAGEWKLNVQPKSTSQGAAGTLTITPEAPELPSPQIYYANVSVTATPPPVSAAAAPMPTAKP